MNIDERYMRRAIELAWHGLGHVSPNPMVGAVIVHDNKIIGEGYHRKYGEGHAEVNAIASVSDEGLLPESTMYVTLEPCSHYGKTPPCAKLIIDKKIPRVVVGCLDPFEKVSGRGINMLREAGVEVTTGILENECRELNRVFMTAHSTGRPWVTLKWAQSADGFIDKLRTPDQPAVKFSTILAPMLMHRQRSLHDAILVGSGTVMLDNPSLTVRNWPGRTPLRMVADRSHRLHGLQHQYKLFDPAPSTGPASILGNNGDSPADYLKELYRRGVTSLMVEGGSELLNSFIKSGLWDEIRVEISPMRLSEGVPAPVLPGIPTQTLTVDGNTIAYFRNTGSQGVKNL